MKQYNIIIIHVVCLCCEFFIVRTICPLFLVDLYHKFSYLVYTVDSYFMYTYVELQRCP